MKKILSVILALAMVLALGVTAFAAEKEEAPNIDVAGVKGPAFIYAGDTAAYKIEGLNTKDKTVTIADRNGFVTIGNKVIDETYVAFEITAPAGSGDKLASVVVTLTPKEGDAESIYLTIDVKGEPAADKVVYAVLGKDAEGKDLSKEDLSALLDERVNDEVAALTNKAIVTLEDKEIGISANAYNLLKAMNYETITFVLSNGVEWTITRGDYTKMNVTADILFGAKVEYRFKSLSDKDLDKNGKKDDWFIDEAAENTVLKALTTTQADVFYVVVDDTCNIANVATKPELVVTVPSAWIDVSNKFNATCYKFNGETVAKVAENLAVKPTTRELTLNLTAGGRYVFVADNYTVVPSAPSTSEKPNASTGANSAAAVVALAVMAVAAVASKKIVK